MDLLTKIKKGLASKGIKGSITEKSVIRDLGIDSLDLMDLVTALEEQENIRIDDDSLLSIKTIADLIEAVNKAKK